MLYLLGLHYIISMSDSIYVMYLMLKEAYEITSYII